MWKKNDELYLIENWDGMARYRIRRVRVESCGKKRMTLLDANSGEMIGREFIPQQRKQIGSIVVALDNEEAVEREAGAAAEEYKAYWIAEYTRRAAHPHADAAYARSMRESAEKMRNATISVFWG